MFSKTTILLPLLVVLNVSLSAWAYLPQPEAMRLCRERTGLRDGDIKQYHARNAFCALDCETRQGTLMTAYADDGTDCNSDQEGYKCLMGVCRGDANKANSSELADLNQVTLSIKSAYVADRDPYPGQGESDPFVVVEVSEGKPNYKDNEVICHTHVIQDSRRPKWNFSCKPLPLKSAAKLRFVVMDSDKPDTQPQFLGSSSVTVESIMSAGPQTLILELPKSLGVEGGPYWIEVELKGKKYSFE